MAYHSVLGSPGMCVYQRSSLLKFISVLPTGEYGYYIDLKMYFFSSQLKIPFRHDRLQLHVFFFFWLSFPESCKRLWDNVRVLIVLPV